MKISLSACFAVLCVSASAFAQQPPAFPMRSQTYAQMSIDNAACYGYANQHTGVNMARQSQKPQKPQATKPGAVHQVAVAAPLPSAMLPGSPAVAASGASAAYPASAASGTAKSMATAPAMTTAPGPASGAASAARPGVASDARAVANASSSSTDAPMPALPPPEPPMVQYWRAYSDCMTERGYMVK